MKKFKFSNFFNSSNSRKSLIAVISILLVICMIVSISYAFFVVLPGDRYELSTTVDIPSCASVTLSNTTSLNLSGDIAAPISDKKALSSDNYAFEFTVSNACRVASSLKISLAPTIESTMPIRAIKYALVEKGTNLPSEGNYLLQENNQKKLTSQIVTDIKKQTGSVVELGYEVLNSTLASGATKNYILYLWIDYYEGDPSQSGQFNNTTMNKSFNAYLVVSDYSQTEGGEYRNYLSDEILGLVSNNEYTSSQDGTKYVVKHEEVRYEGTTYDAGVRYEGNAPDNYITFNGNEEWRIIGTFEGSTIGLEPGKQYTKIIRNTSMHKLWDCSYWSDDTGACEGNSENDWANSSLNAYLNGEYLSSLTDANKIAINE